MSGVCHEIKPAQGPMLIGQRLASREPWPLPSSRYRAAGPFLQASPLDGAWGTAARCKLRRMAGAGVGAGPEGNKSG